MSKRLRRDPLVDIESVYINVAHGSCHWWGDWIVDEIHGDVPATAQTVVPKKTMVLLIQRDSRISTRSDVMLGHRSTGIKKRTYPNGRIVDGDTWMVEKIHDMLFDGHFLRKAIVTDESGNRLAGLRVQPTGKYGKFYFRPYFPGEVIPNVSFSAKEQGLGIYRAIDDSQRHKIELPYPSSYTMEDILDGIGGNKEWTLLVSFSCLDLRLQSGQ